DAHSYRFYSIATDNVGNAEPTHATPDAQTIVSIGHAVVSGRYVFYNRSAFDSNDLTNNAADDKAVATDKQALLPGQTATFANYTSYDKGINGILIDVSNLPPGTLTAADFAFKIGNDNNPAGWANASAPASITVRRG